MFLLLVSIVHFLWNVNSYEGCVLFILCSEEDITKTEYNGFFGAKRLSAKEILAQSAHRILENAPRSIRISTASESKVNRVCDALLKAMLPETERYVGLLDVAGGS